MSMFNLNTRGTPVGEPESSKASGAGAESVLSGAALDRAILGLRALPSGGVELARVDYLLERLAVELNGVTAFEHYSTRRLPVVLQPAPYCVQSVREMEDGMRLCGVLSEHRGLYRSGSNRLLVRECLEAREDVQCFLTEDGWDLEVVEALFDGRILCSGTHTDFGRELRLLSEIGAGVWSIRLVSTDSGELRGIASAPDGRVFVASSRGLGCIADVSEPTPRISWFGDARCEYIALDATTEGRIVTASREGLEMWHIPENGDARCETISLNRASRGGESKVVTSVRILAHGEVLARDSKGLLAIHRRAEDGSWSEVFDITIQGEWRAVSVQALPDGSCIVVTDKGSVQRLFRAVINERSPWECEEILHPSQIKGYPGSPASFACGYHQYGHVFATGEVLLGTETHFSGKSFEIVCSRVGGSSDVAP